MIYICCIFLYNLVAGIILFALPQSFVNNFDTHLVPFPIKFELFHHILYFEVLARTQKMLHQLDPRIQFLLPVDCIILKYE